MNATRLARFDKKLKQTLVLAVPLLLALLMGDSLIRWGIIPSCGGKSLAGLFCFLVLILIVFGAILPLGKTSKERRAKYFKKKLLREIVKNEKELVSIKLKFAKLKERLEILKKIQERD